MQLRYRVDKERVVKQNCVSFHLSMSLNLFHSFPTVTSSSVVLNQKKG